MTPSPAVRVFLVVFGCVGLLLAWVDFTSTGIFKGPWGWLHGAWHLFLGGGALVAAFYRPRSTESK